MSQAVPAILSFQQLHHTGERKRGNETIHLVSPFALDIPVDYYALLLLKVLLIIIWTNVFLWLWHRRPFPFSEVTWFVMLIILLWAAPLTVLLLYFTPTSFASTLTSHQ